MDEDLVRDGRYARLDLRGARTGRPRPVTVGFVEWPDGSIVVAAPGETAWAANLAADPVARITIGPRTFTVTAEPLDPDDPRRAAAVRDLILRYGTPSERLGSGPVFRLVPDSSRA
jgi:deazaflavin-dependent oxidoreductase (nitroreductase family)